jgi:hypothetical protein
VWRYPWCSKAEEHESLEVVEVFIIVSVLNQSSLQVGNRAMLFWYNIVLLELLQFDLVM